MTSDGPAWAYPPDAVGWLVDRLRIQPGAVVVDLAAGTGKLTRLLLPTGASVVAIEPVLGMRRLLRQILPSVPVIAGTAEAMALKGSSVDAVCAAQAFHWFDADTAFAELARVLRPGGRVGILWNVRDRSVDWVDRIWQLMHDVEGRGPWRDHDSWDESAFGARPGFGPLEHTTFHHEHVTTPAGVVERIRGVSHIAALEPEAKAGVLDRVRTVLENHPETRGRDQLRVPYRVDCYWTERM